MYIHRHDTPATDNNKIFLGSYWRSNSHPYYKQTLISICGYCIYICILNIYQWKSCYIGWLVCSPYTIEEKILSMSARVKSMEWSNLQLAWQIWFNLYLATYSCNLTLFRCAKQMYYNQMRVSIELCKSSERFLLYFGGEINWARIIWFIAFSSEINDIPNKIKNFPNQINTTPNSYLSKSNSQLSKCNWHFSSKWNFQDEIINNSNQSLARRSNWTNCDTALHSKP